MIDDEDEDDGLNDTQRDVLKWMRRNDEIFLGMLTPGDMADMHRICAAWLDSAYDSAANIPIPTEPDEATAGELVDAWADSLGDEPLECMA